MNLKIGAKIRSLRTRDGVTQDKLAAALGVTAQAVSKWESENGYPDLEYLTPIANFFNVTLDELFEHDLAEKQRKIDEYCERYDALARRWSPPEERVALMRQALAEFPADEKLLYRLATALWYKWDDDVRKSEAGTRINGKYKRDQNKVKSVKGWEEPTAIMEELLSASVNDEIRYGSTQLLIFIYSNIGEKERAIALAEHYPDSKNRFLSTAFMLDCEEDSVMYSQRLILDALWDLTYQLPRLAKDREMKKAAIGKLLALYDFIFAGRYEFYHNCVYELSEEYAELLLCDGAADEALAMLEKAFACAKAFDAVLDTLRSEGEIRYSSPYTDKLKEESKGVYAAKKLPDFLGVLKAEDRLFYQKLHGDLRYEDLIRRAEEALAKAE